LKHTKLYEQEFNSLMLKKVQHKPIAGLPHLNHFLLCLNEKKAVWTSKNPPLTTTER